MPTMTLSFVIPAHNEEQYLPTCLDSILREVSDKPYEVEIIVVNNASTDRTKEIAESYDGITVVDEPGKGLAKARQAGFLRARGDLIANIDADAMLPAGWLEKVFREFSGDEKLACLSGPHVYYDTSLFIRCLVKIFYSIASLFYAVNRYLLNVGSVVQGGNFICRRTALVAAGGYDISITFYGEDTDIARRLHKIGRVKFALGLPIYISGRRIAAEGVFTMALRYGLNYFWMIFLKRPFSKTAVDVRSERCGGKLVYQPFNKKREWLIATVSLSAILGALAAAGFLIYRLAGGGVTQPSLAATKTENGIFGKKFNELSKQLKYKIEAGLGVFRQSP